jgi:hypothetical protein
MNEVSKFIASLQLIEMDKKLFLDNINVNEILTLLQSLVIHEANYINYFQKDQIIDFIKEYGFKEFSLIIFNGNGHLKSIASKHRINLVERSFDLLDKDTIRINRSKRRLGGPQDTKYGLDQKTINSINLGESISNKSYLIEGRKPIFMIYPIELKHISKDDRSKFSTKEIDMIEGLVNTQETNNLIVYGFGIGFPSNSKQTEKKKKVFYINTRTNWWNLMLEKDNQEDE